MGDVEFIELKPYIEMDIDFKLYLNIAACIELGHNKIAYYKNGVYGIICDGVYMSNQSVLICDIPEKFIKKINLTPRTINIL